MKVMVSETLEERHLVKIRAVSDDVELVAPDSPGEALEEAHDVEVMLGGPSREMFDRAKSLKWVQNGGAGIDGLMYPEFVESDVTLTSMKGNVGVHLADHAMALLLGLVRGIAYSVRKADPAEQVTIRANSWELIDKTMGIVGLGGTGREIARRAHAFGMRIIAVDPEEVDLPPEVVACWKMDRFHDLLRESDVVAIGAPLTEETRGMFDRAAFQAMRDHALLISVTRGKIVEEEALMEALDKGWIGGAGLDVTPQEPLPREHPLWHMDNVIITPHTAGGSPNRNDRLVDLFCENLRRYIDGRPLLSLIDKRKGF